MSATRLLKSCLKRDMKVVTVGTQWAYARAQATGAPRGYPGGQNWSNISAQHLRPSRYAHWWPKFQKLKKKFFFPKSLFFRFSRREIPIVHHHSGHNGFSSYKGNESSHWYEKQRTDVKINNVYEIDAGYAINYWKRSMYNLLGCWSISLL